MDVEGRSQLLSYVLCINQAKLKLSFCPNESALQPSLCHFGVFLISVWYKMVSKGN